MLEMLEMQETQQSTDIITRDFIINNIIMKNNRLDYRALKKYKISPEECYVLMNPGVSRNCLVCGALCPFDNYNKGYKKTCSVNCKHKQTLDDLIKQDPTYKLFIKNLKKIKNYKELISLYYLELIIDIFKGLDDAGDVNKISHALLDNFINDNKIHCKQCGKEFYPSRKTQKFCSVSCANVYKNTNINIRRKKSKRMIEYHKNLDPDAKDKQNKKTSETLKSFYKTEEGLKRIEEKKHRDAYKSVAWNNIVKYCNENDFIPMFSELDIKEKRLKNLKYLKYRCKKCKEVTNCTISTNTKLPVCDKCNPKPIVKHKSQNEVMSIVAEGTNQCIQDDRTIIKPLELDIIDVKNNFAIEYDGLLSHSYGKSKLHWYNTNINEENPDYHLNKTELCEEKGIQLYHIFENEWLDENKKEIWISMIRDKQGLNKKVGARKCTIKEVSTKDAREFINNNHMQGYINAKIKIGLYYRNVLMSIMTFSKPRFNDKVEYELIRFCTKQGYTVQGGGSKLLKYFEKTYKPKSLISYANRRWSNGNFYVKSGFNFVNCTKPNYFYFKINENILYSRNKFQKHKLKDLLESFDNTMTEKENMYNNEYRRIYDCGNKVFIKEY